MHFRTFTSVAILACAAHASAEPKPYRMAMMPVPGLSLMRRDSPGYQPDQTACGAGNACSEACGPTYLECPSSNSDTTHCYDPSVQQSCCDNGSGNSCDAGYYCTSDTSNQNWCCPDSMSLSQCAAAYSVSGGLQAATSTAAPTSTTPATSTASPTTTTSAPATTSALSTTSSAGATVVTKTDDETVTVPCSTSAGHSTAWSGFNSTATGVSPNQPVGSGQPVPPVATGAPQPPSPSTISGAATSSVSGLLLLAAGVVALL